MKKLIMLATTGVITTFSLDALAWPTECTEVAPELEEGTLTISGDFCNYPAVLFGQEKGTPGYFHP
jgi:hypothetical protein